MKKSLRGLVIATLSSPLFFTPAVQAATASDLQIQAPKFTLFTSLGALKVQHKDFDPEAFDAEVGVKGKIHVDQFKMFYQLAADVSDAINSKDTGGPDGKADIHVREAKVVFPTAYGAFVLAPRGTSGQYRDLYHNINIFEYNKTHNGKVNPTGNSFFGQGDEGQDVVAYGSPAFHGVRVKGAILSVKENNHNNVDVKSFRVVYEKGHLNMGAGIVVVDKSMAGATQDYKRMAATAGYTFDRLDLGATYEHNKDTFGPAGDYDSYGITGRYHLGDGYSASLGYFNKNSKNDLNDDSGVVLQLKRKIGKHVALWAETGQYDKADSNIALGVNIKY